jgi:2,4-diaminopentanoate dehydrogenase
VENRVPAFEPGRRSDRPIREDIMPIRVVHVGTGFVGIQALGGVIDHPGLELAGLVVHDAGKVGRDAGEMAGLGPNGILAVGDLDTALGIGVDVVSYFATTHGRLKVTIEDFCRILSSGVNIVTTSVGALIHPPSARPDVLARLESACQAGNSTCFSTGVDPGFFSDYLPVVLSGCARRIDAVRIFEMAVYESGAQSDSVAFEQMGFGAPIETVPPIVHPEGLRANWGGVLTMIGDQLGVTFDGIVADHEMLPAPETFAYQGRTIQKGTVAGMRFQVAGVRNGREIVSLAHVTRAREDFAPEWPRPLRGDAYRVVIEGDPRLECECEFSSPSGNNLAGGFAITAMRAINAIPAVVASESGVKSVFKLTLITGRGRVT